MKFWRFISSLDLGSWKLGTGWLCMAAANHMPQLKQYCSWMFEREDWEVAYLHKLIEKEYKNHGIRKPHNTDACGFMQLVHRYYIIAQMHLAKYPNYSFMKGYLRYILILKYPQIYQLYLKILISFLLAVNIDLKMNEPFQIPPQKS